MVVGVALGAAVAGVLLAGFPARSSAALGDDGVLVAASAGAAVVYQRATQELQLFDGGQLVAAAGPDRTEAELAATLLQALLAPGDRVLVSGCGDRLAALLLRPGSRAELTSSGGLLLFILALSFLKARVRRSGR